MTGKEGEKSHRLTHCYLSDGKGVAAARFLSPSPGVKKKQFEKKRAEGERGRR